jgi:predicted acetyltransferase
MGERLELIEPDASWREAFLSLVDDYLSAGEQRYGDLRGRVEQDFAGLIDEWRRVARGIDVPADAVQQERWWLIRGGRDILGHVYLRPDADEDLRQRMGQIGVYIRPSQRGKGYGTIGLRLGLAKMREYGLTEVTIVTRHNNAASKRTIEKNGGVFVFERYSPTLQTWMYGYRVDLGAGPRGKEPS